MGILFVHGRQQDDSRMDASDEALLVVPVASHQGAGRTQSPETQELITLSAGRSFTNPSSQKGTHMPPATTFNQDKIQTLSIKQEISIAAPIEIAWESVLEQLGPESQMPDGKPFPFKLEQWPGGRLYRDLGNNTGHLWGHVQVIKPPMLLEIIGPLPMSYPAINHLQYKLTADGGRTRLTFAHRSMGMIPAEHRENMGKGWGYKLARVRE